MAVHKIRVPKTLTIEEVRKAFQQVNTELGYDSEPVFTGATLTGLTPNRLVKTNDDNVLVSVTDLTNWIAGTTNQVIVTDDTDGTVTLSLPQNIHTGATPTFSNLTLTTLKLGVEEGTIEATTGNLTLSSSNGNLTLSSSNNTIQASDCQLLTDSLVAFTSITVGNEADADDSIIYFKSSGNDGSITYDQSDDEFDFGSSAIITTGTGRFDGGDIADRLVVGSDNGEATRQFHVFGPSSSSSGLVVAQFQADREGYLSSITIGNSAGANVNNQTGFNLNCYTSTAHFRGVFSFRGSFSDITDGSRTSSVGLYTADNGSFNTVLLFSGHDVSVPNGDLDVVNSLTAGTIQADNGYTGSWTNNEGNTVTVVGGIITDVS